MAKSDLLKEAIADAKAVKETALANAKIALEEAFAPRIQNMLSAKLSEDMEEDMEEGMHETDMEEGMHETDMEEGMHEQDMEDEMSDDMGDEMSDDMGDEMGNDVGDLSIDMDGDGEMDFEGDIYSKDDAMADDDMADDAMSDADADAEYEDEDVDGLDEIIAELEGDLDEGMEEDMDEMYEDMAGGSGTDSNAPSMDDEMIGESIDDIINEILDEEMEEGMHEDEDDMEEAMHEMQQGAESVDSKGADLNEALTSLEESYKTINHLRSVINEVNLLNAKLLYTNKLFRSFELSEPQKMKVIENFDRAKTTRETKLVFSTLAESFKKPTKKRVVKESYASRASTSTAPSKKFKENTPILSEGFEQANRWKKLAGLI